LQVSQIVVRCVAVDVVDVDRFANSVLLKARDA